MDTGENSSAIGTSSNDRKRKKPVAKADVFLEEEDGDLRCFFSKKRLFNTKIPVPILIKRIFDLLRMYDLMPDWENFKCMLHIYEISLHQIVDSINEHDSIRCKIWDDFLDFTDKVSEPEQALYSLRTYPIFLEWLYENKTLGDCRGKAIEHMLKLLDSNIIIQDDDEYSGVPWRKKPKPQVYNMPEELVCKLCPYSRFLKWLQEDGREEVVHKVSSDYNEQQKYRSKLIAEILSSLSDEIVTRIGAQKVLYTVHLCVGRLKSNHEVEQGKNKEPAEKNQKAEKNQTSTANPNTLNPKLDGFSKDDRKLLKRFHRKYQGFPLQVFDEYREYLKQITESEGFDFDTFPGSFSNMTPIEPIGMYYSQLENMDFKELAELAIEKHGKGEIKFDNVVRVNTRISCCARYYYLTFLGHYEKSPYHFKALVEKIFSTTKKEEAYKVVNFRWESIDMGPSVSVSNNNVRDPGRSNRNKIPEARVEKLVKEKGHNHSAKRVTRASAKSIAHILESEVKMDKPKAGRATRRSSRSITQVSESKETKEKVFYDPEGDDSTHSTCKKHMEDLSLLKSFVDMPEDKLLQKFREADRSTGVPLIKELRQYFEQVSKSEGFHIGKYHGFFYGLTSIIKPVNWSLWAIEPISVEKLAELAIQSYNNDNRSQFGFQSITEVNVSESLHYHFYISFLARTGDAAETFQALVLVNMLLPKNYEVHFCRRFQLNEYHAC